MNGYNSPTCFYNGQAFHFSFFLFFGTLMNRCLNLCTNLRDFKASTGVRMANRETSLEGATRMKADLLMLCKTLFFPDHILPTCEDTINHS